MSLCTANFETGTDGSAVLTTDTGSPTAWDAISATNPTLIYSNATAAHGTLAGKFHLSAGAGTSYAAWSTALGTISGDSYGRIYLYLPAIPTAPRTSLELVQFYSGATLKLRFGILVNSGFLYARDSAGSGPTQGSGTVIATGQWARLEWHATISTTVGFIELKLFNTADSTTADYTLTASPATLDTGASVDSIRIGQTAGNAFVNDWYVDDIIAGASSYPGPFVSSSTSASWRSPLGTKIPVKRAP